MDKAREVAKRDGSTCIRKHNPLGYDPLCFDCVICSHTIVHCATPTHNVTKVIKANIGMSSCKIYHWFIEQIDSYYFTTCLVFDLRSLALQRRDRSSVPNWHPMNIN